LGRRKKNPPDGEPEDHALGRSQGGFGTKLHLICDGEGTPIAVAVGPGQEHETQQAIPLLEEATAWPEQPAKVAGDKAYSAGWLRRAWRLRSCRQSESRMACACGSHKTATASTVCSSRRASGSVIPNSPFFFPQAPLLQHQEPQRQKRQRLVVVPAAPALHLVI